MNKPDTARREENRHDRLDAARDPGAVPRRDLKNDDVAVVSSSEIDPDPNSEIYEAYEDEDNAPAPSAAPQKGGQEQPHKTIP